MKDPLLSILQINKFMGSGPSYTHVLKDINLTVDRGEFIAIVGQSGSGKSTLMNIIGCLDEQSSGSYYISGIETATLTPNQLALLRSQTFGFVFQRYNLLSNQTAIENVSLPAVYTGIPLEMRKARAVQLLQQFGLGDKLDCKPNELSGGQQQRVSIARALMNKGEILLADEPTGALDTSSGIAVMEILNELNKQGQTVILVTHNLDVAKKIQRVIEIKDGRIVSDYKREKRKDIIRADQLESVDGAKKFALFVEALKMAIQSVISNKMRSLLTMLGIIIGVAAVISVIALGRGSQAKLISDIQTLGTNTIEIFPGQGFGDLQSWRIKTLTVSDSEALKKKTYIKGASPKTDATGVVVYRNNSVNSLIYGVGNQYFAVKGMSLESGRVFSRKDVENINSVAVIDQKMKSILFPHNYPIGKFIICNNHPLEVIGVIKNIETQFGSESNPSIFIPYNTLMFKMTGNKSINSVIVKIDNEVGSHAAEKDITIFLQKRHNNIKDFFTFNIDNVKKAIEKTTGTMTLLISSIALISLAVGGIGVMNIMLVSVTERTSEIGLRMAIGARRIDILTQFLIESIVLCSLGGVLGIALSFFIKPILAIISPDSLMIYSLDSFLFALLFSSCVGVLFGFIPARNASLLMPIDALRGD